MIQQLFCEIFLHPVSPYTLHYIYELLLQCTQTFQAYLQWKVLYYVLEGDLRKYDCNKNLKDWVMKRPTATARPTNLTQNKIIVFSLSSLLDSLDCNVTTMICTIVKIILYRFSKGFT